MEDLSLVVLS